MEKAALLPVAEAEVWVADAAVSGGKQETTVANMDE